MKKKLLIITCVLVAVAAIVAGSVFGTIAYLAAASKVSNVFTYGEVFISMDESKVDQHGVPLKDSEGNPTGERTDNNSYLLMPGESYTKDPQIHVQPSTQPCYLFLVTRNQITRIEDPTKPTMAKQMVANGWGIYKDTSAGSRVWIYCGNVANVDQDTMHAIKPVAVCGSNNKTMADGVNILHVEADKPIAIFTQFHVTSSIGADLSLYSGAEVTLNAVGIQASVFGNIGDTQAVADAWTAVVNQFPYIQDNVGTTVTPTPDAGEDEE